MSQSDRRLSKGEKVLVTGANGYIASSIVDVLLEEGYNVRGTVRTEKPWLNKYFDDKYGKDRFETTILAAIEDEGAFDEAVKGVSGIIHVASDVSLSPDPDVVLPKVIAGTINFLKAAAKEPSVKSVVLTSSSSAVLIPEANKEGVVVDENTWNDGVLEAIRNKDMPKDLMPFLVYAASKTRGEQEFWKWVKENNPTFVANTVVPNMNMGEILMPEIPGSTMGWVRKLLEGEDNVAQIFPPQWFIDVRDDARIHVAALLDPTVKNERLFAFAEAFNWNDIVSILRKLRPENKNIKDAPANEGRDLTVVKPRERAEGLIKSFFNVPGWTKLEDSIAAGIADMK